MKYVTGIHALNLPCELDTDGDWHCSGLQWERPTFADSDKSIFGLYGIEYDKEIPEHTGKFAVANHIRALLDMLDKGQFGYAQGMRDDFIDSDDYTDEVFEKVLMLKDNDNWNEISDFMGSEYYMKWVNFIKNKGLKE